MTESHFQHRACPQAEEKLALLVEQLSPERAMVLSRDGNTWLGLAHYPQETPPEEVYQALSQEALQHIVEGGEAKVFASPSPEVEPLVALMGGALDVVMVSQGSAEAAHHIFYLARPLQAGLYGDEDLQQLSQVVES